LKWVIVKRVNNVVEISLIIQWQQPQLKRELALFDVERKRKKRK
jgi:hypothetical protein